MIFALRTAVLHLALLALVLAGGLSPQPAHAQATTPNAVASAAAPKPGTAFDVVTAEPVEVGEPDSPRASLAHYFAAVRSARWSEAERYLVLDEKHRPRAEALARRLKAVIDDTGWIDLDTVSDAHLGRTDDGLPRNLEEVARFTLDGRTESLRMVRRVDAAGPHWAFSPATVGRIDAWYATLPDRWLRDLLVGTGMDFMLRAGPLELLWWQWIAVTGLVALAWLLGGLLGQMTLALLRKTATLANGAWDDALLKGLGGPLTLVWGLVLFRLAADQLLLLAPAARLLNGLTAAGIVTALFWALWRGTNVVVQHLAARPWAQDNPSARTLLLVGGNLSRGVIAFAGVLAVLSALGYPMGTVLAGLGIGGVALALGAQKTLENFGL